MSPIFEFIERDFAVPAAAIAVIGTLPPLCFALGAFFTPRLARRRGITMTTAFVLVTMTIGLTGRAIAWNDNSLVATSALTFVSVGALNVLLPPLIRLHYPERIGTLTTLYATLMAVGTFVPPLLSPPIALSAGWRFSLLIWAFLSLSAVVPWITVALRQGKVTTASSHPNEPQGPPFRLLFRSPVVWGVTALCATPGFIAYSIFAWYPQMLSDTTGATAAEAGLALGLYAAMGLPANFIVPLVVARLRNVGPLIGLGGAFFSIAFLGMLFLPASGMWFWAVLGGAGQMMLPMMLVLINLRTRTSWGTVWLSSVVQGPGYVLAALGPLAVGTLHSIFGGWDAAFIALIVVGIGGCLVGLLAASPRFLEDSVVTFP